MWITINEMYQYTKENNTKLLSEYSADWWNDYKTNYTRYDKLFARLYSSFRYFYQNKDSQLATLTTDFTDEVYNHLMLNAKKYEELYRVNVLDDNAYSFLDNFKVTETMDKDSVSGARNDTTTTTEDDRQDVTTSVIGGKTDNVEHQVSAFNSSTYQQGNKDITTLAQQTNTDTFDKGEQITTEALQKGSQTDTEDYTLTKSGNLGYTSNAEHIKEHIGVWTEFEFYAHIFSDICVELLLS